MAPPIAAGLRFSCLGSGSEGNALLLESKDPAEEPLRGLIDCGLGLKELDSRLAARGLSVRDLDFVLVTHEHGDHLGGVGALARATSVPVFLTHGTHHAAPPESLRGAELVFVKPEQPFELCGLEILPVPVCHDAREPVAYRVDKGDSRLGVVTDLGMASQVLIDAFQGCSALLLEFNHDPDMLQRGEYPPKLKARVGGDYGHLSNQQAVSLLEACLHEGLRTIVAGHLSQKNNHPDLVMASVQHLLLGDRFSIAEQDTGLPWAAL